MSCTAERFFILSRRELEMKQAQRTELSGPLPWEERDRRVHTGVDTLLISDVEDTEDAWHKIVSWCSGD